MAVQNHDRVLQPFAIPLFTGVPQAVEALKQRLASLQEEERFIKSVLAHEGQSEGFSAATATVPQKPMDVKAETPKINGVQPGTTITVAKASTTADAEERFRTGRRQAMEDFFAAGGHMKATNHDVAKMFGASKSLVSLYLNEAIKKGLCTPRQGPGGRSVAK